MAEYEFVLVFDPRLSDEEFDTLSGAFKDLVAEQGAELSKEESWGKRRLAYPIAKQTEGRYHIYTYASEKPIAVQPVEARLVQNEKILRYLTVRTDEGRLRRRGSEPEAAESDASAPAAAESAS
jgi:small subunit ribosomal protein S6